MRVAWIVLIAAAALGVPGLATLSPAEADGVTWLSDYSEARKVSERTGRPILLVFR